MIARTPHGDHRKHDTALRHKIRNLRAKLCCKEQKRSKNLLKMEQNKQLQHSCHHHRGWDFSKESESPLYIPPPPTPLEKHLFEKLTPAELEQIKEDKLYYVGEEFLQHFDRFLDSREREREKPKTAHPKNTTPTPALQPLFEVNHKSSLSTGEGGHLLLRQNACEQRMRRVVRTEGIQAKRKLITEQDATRRAYIRMKGRENMERHLQNHSRACKDRQERIQQRNYDNMMRTAQSFTRAHNPHQVAQITRLSEQLRTLCLMRHSNSAKLLYRQ